MFSIIIQGTLQQGPVERIGRHLLCIAGYALRIYDKIDIFFSRRSQPIHIFENRMTCIGDNRQEITFLPDDINKLVQCRLQRAMIPKIG